MRLATILSAALVIGAVSTPALAAQVEVSDAWFRALPAGLPAGGYFKLHNLGAAEVVLTGAQSPACGMVMLHRSVDTGGMERMEMVDSVAVPPGGTVEFKPGGYHLMCMKPKPAMKQGATVSVTLEFADGTKTSAGFAVKGAKGQ